MKVKELIKKLQRCDADARVVFVASMEDEYEIDYVAEVKRIGDEKETDHFVVEIS